MQTREYRQQLHQRIVARRGQLETEQARPQMESQHARGIDVALAELAMHLGNNWEHVDQVEASNLSAWLESTRFLTEQ